MKHGMFFPCFFCFGEICRLRCFLLFFGQKIKKNFQKKWNLCIHASLVLCWFSAYCMQEAALHGLTLQSE
jgi:hypothetical protein